MEEEGVKTATYNIFQGKNNKIKNLKKNHKNLCSPHRCQVAVLEECPAVGRGVHLVCEGTFVLGASDRTAGFKDELVYAHARLQGRRGRLSV